ncbi:MAG TPA: condensation domain-containing protein [Solirubrobacterales bacterium]|nr:condensation domain-containing protein [Solirubrobacterales bacterium]
MSESAEVGQAAPAPLSVAQEGIWYSSRLAPGRLIYNETVSIRKDGPLDVGALRRAFDEIVRRHEALRTNYEVIDGEPVQVVRPVPSFALPVIDLGQLTPEEAERQAVRTAAAVSQVPYDLRRDSMIRPRLFKFPGEHHRLYLAIHHIAFDGVSLARVVLGELVSLYDAFAAGLPSPLPDPPTSYVDYARWEQEWIEQPRAERRLNYWVERLTPPPPSLPIPLDHPRPEVPKLGGGAVALSIPPEQVEGLRRLGEAGGASLFQVLVACWAVLVGRYSGSSEVVFATAAELRQRPEFRSLVGCCVTQVVLRIELDGDPSIADLVTRVRNELLDGLDNLVPFERVIRRLPPAAERGGNPVYQTMIVLEPATETPDPSWSLRQIDSLLTDAVGSHKLDLELQLDERDDNHLVGRLIYDRDLFEPATARRFAGHFTEICAAVAAEPDVRAATVPMLTEAERRRQLVEWNSTAAERPSGSVADLVAARAAEQPDAIAVRAPAPPEGTAVAEGDASITYAELERRAEEVAGTLRDAGVGEGDVVALVARPSVDLAVGALGILKAGAAHLLLDPALPADRLGAVLRDAGARAILREGLGDPEPAATDPARPPLDGACAVQYAEPDADEPLGVVVTNSAVVNVATALAPDVELTADDTTLMLGPSVYASPAIALWMPLIAGAKIVTVPVTADGAAVSKLVRAESVTFLAAPPRAWEELIETGLKPARSLRGLSFGDPLPPSVAETARKRCRVFWNAYGPAASAGACTLGRVETNGAPTAGRPLANTRVYVLDRDGQPAPIGVPGELLIAGDSLATYLGRPDPFVDTPLDPSPCLPTGARATWRPDATLRVHP